MVKHEPELHRPQHFLVWDPPCTTAEVIELRREAK